MNAEAKPLRRQELAEIRARDHFSVEEFEKAFDALLGHIAFMEEEEDHLRRVVIRLGKKLRGVVEAFRGPPADDELHSTHDADQLARRFVEVLRALTFAGRTTGGVPGPDANLMQALDAAEAILPPVRPLTDMGVPLPSWEAVKEKCRRGETLTRLEVFIMNNEPADPDRRHKWTEDLRAALDSIPRPRSDER